MGGDARGVRGGRRGDSHEGKNDENVGDKLLDFGRGLWHKGSKAVEGAVDKVKGADTDDLARKAMDTAKQLGKNVDVNDVSKIAGVAGSVAFPQAALLNAVGGDQIVGGIANKFQIKRLLDDPASMGDKMVVNFDVFDKDNSGFLTKEKLGAKQGGFLSGITSDTPALGTIMQAGFKTINSLDGLESKKGLSRDDVKAFKLLYDKDALSSHISSEAWSSAKWWGLGSGAVAGGAGWLAKAGGAKIGCIAAGTAVVVGGLSYAISRSHQSSFYEEKRAEMDNMIKMMKNAF